MEKTLKALFDFQRFLGTPRLAEVIAETENRFGHVLSDDDLERVTAAGEPAAPKKQGESPDE